MTPVVEMLGITKTFPGVVANDHVDFRLEQGEVHGLLGENGAGKTTLMNVLYGLYQPDGGEIRVDGQPVTIHSPRDALALGFGMVHQHFQLVPRLTVAENFLLGMRSRREPFLESRRSVEARILEFSRTYQLPVEPNRPVWQLSVGEQQRAEILKALYWGARVLILDEPTSVLTPQEVASLACILNVLIEKGKSIVLITHKLDEVMSMTQQVTVMRDGAVVGGCRTGDTSRAELARLMVGRELSFAPRPAATAPGKPALELKVIKALDNRRLPALKEVSLEVRQGEIVGLAGVDGNGQIELEEVLTGLRPALSGRVFLAGQDVTHSSTWARRRQGLGYIPSDRYHRGLVHDFTVAENFALGQHKGGAFDRRGLLDLKAISRWAQSRVEEYRIHVPAVTTLAGKLSGGNAQRVILGRELSRKPGALLACQPTRGLDVGATEYVHSRLLEQRDRGAGILLVSADLDEILSLSDRIAVIFGGQIVGVLSRQEAAPQTVGLMMAGAKDWSTCDEPKERNP